MPNRIPLDPKLPKTFDATPNDTRSKAHLGIHFGATAKPLLGPEMPEPEIEDVLGPVSHVASFR